MVLAVVLLTFIAFAFAIVWRPATVLAFAICVYPFEQWAQANSTFFAVNSSAINYALGLLTLFALACVIMRGRNPLNPVTAGMWVWLALYVFAGMTCFWSLDRDVSMFLFKYHAPYVITFAGLLPLVIQKPEDVRIGFVSTLVFGSIVMLLLLLNTSIHGWGRTIEVAHSQAVVNRVGGSTTRLAPLSVAEMSGELALIVILLNFSGVSRFWQVARWLVVFIALALIYRSGSRGQLFATLAALVAFIAMSRGTKQVWGWVTAAASVCLIAIVTVASFVGFADTKGRWNLDTMNKTIKATRLDYCIELMDFWTQSSPFNWFFGLGSSASYDPRILGHYCHVLVVEVLAELGAFGLTLMMIFFVIVVRDGYRLYKMTKSSNVDRGVVVTLLALFFFQVILTFKERSFLTHTFAFGCGLMICRYAAVVKSYRKKETAESVRAWYAAQYANWQPASETVSAG